MRPSELPDLKPMLPARRRIWRSAVAVVFLVLLSLSTFAQTASFDFGDAPAPYPTLLADNGARHIISPRIFLGKTVDSEKDGQPNATATGDDTGAPGIIAPANDEDGISFTTAQPFPAGTVVVLQVNASVSGFLDAWVDFNQNGSWNDEGDKIFDSSQIAGGANTLRFTVPSNAVGGRTYARFRFSTKGQLLPTGQASDGEVEDYAINIQGEPLDYGDAPQKYPVTFSQNGARHRVLKGFQLGKAIDVELDGQPSSGADGDDKSPIGAASDEDGVIFLSTLTTGQEAQVEVTPSAAGFIDAWIDFNQNGSWDDTGEQIAVSVAVAAGANTLKFIVPTDAGIGTTFARFRLSTKGQLRPVGLAPDGEVEDYAVSVVKPVPHFDFGDAPQQYPVLLSQDGARHFLNPDGPHLGQFVDAEFDGFPTTLANGDDLNPSSTAPDDEDGVTIPTAGFQASQSASVVVNVSLTGKLDAWIDFNGNGSWEDAGEKIADSLAVASGANTVTFKVPDIAKVGDTYARFRVSRAGGLKSTGAAQDGEVEDYLVKITAAPVNLDFGDAPDPYPVTLKQDGARHVVSRNGPFLGKTIDPEPDGQPSALADGDDKNPPTTGPDEDGVTFTSVLRPGDPATVDVVVTGQGLLDAWIDFNKNGSWSDTGEQIFTSVAVVAGINHLTFTVPATATVADTFARFRISLKGGLKPTGLAPEGEVEDYLVTIAQPIQLDFGDAPEIYPVTLKQDGARHVILKGFNLGRLIDAEKDGQPSALANGDDNSPPNSASDEDGVKFVTNPLLAGDAAVVEVFATGEGGRLDAWVDFNVDGDWNDELEQIFSSQILAPGVNTLTFTVPSGAKISDTFARFRFSRRGGLKPTGLAPDGEVEDYPIKVAAPTVQLDFGDAPQQYPVTLAQNGARHQIFKGLSLGRLIDAEPDGQPSSLADGDDTHPAGASDDEDGVRFITTPLIPGSIGVVSVLIVGEGRLDAWVDFNRDGDWDDKGEQVFTSIPLGPGTHTLRFPVPDDAVPGPSFARFRLSRQGGLTPRGAAPDGEVEDYPVAIGRGEPDCNPQTHRGTDFWLTFPGNYAPDPDNTNKLTLSIVGAAGTTGKVEIPGLAFTANFTIPAGLQSVVTLPKDADLHDANDLIENKGIHVTSSALVAVYALNRVRFTTDGYLGLPVGAIGQFYVVQGYANEFTGVPDLNGTQFALVATADDTLVAFLPRVATGSHPANTVYGITLNKGQTYQLRNTNDFANDLSGTLIAADKPISVFGSHQCAAIPDSTKLFCNHLVEQLVPINRAGYQFLTMPFKTRSADTFRFQALFNGTLVLVNGIPTALLNAGEFSQTSIGVPSQILSSKPILVTQYSNSADFDGVKNSDPFMVVVPQAGQFLKNYEVSVPNSNFVDNYINVVAPTAVVGALTLNGASVPAANFTPIAGSLYSGAQLKVPPGVYLLAATLPFTATVYGYSEYDGYGYPAGMFFGDTLPPTLICGQDTITVELGGNVAGTAPCTVPIPDLRQKVQVSDNCGMPERVVVQQNPAPGTLVGPGTHPIVLSTPDANGNIGFCIVQFVVVDPSPLLIDCPKDMLVSCNAPGGAKVSFRAVAHRRCDANIDVICEPPSGSFFPEGETVVNCKATDTDGTEVTCSFKITVKCGSTGPSITITHADTTHVSIAWTTGQILETATSVTGPWTAVSNAQSPFNAELKNSQGFFRIR
jgi:hypothetical protein